MKYSEVFQIVPDSYSGAAESSPGVAIGYNGNLNTDQALPLTTLEFIGKITQNVYFLVNENKSTYNQPWWCSLKH